MSIRLKLLLLGLATLVLPWAGCRYAREMESALREGEQSSLQSVAQSIASSLQGRTDLLYREPLPVQSSDETQTDSATVAKDDAKPTPYDLRPVLLSSQPFLDGYVEEWPQNKGAYHYYTHGQQHIGLISNEFERMLYVKLDVQGGRGGGGAPGAGPRGPGAGGERGGGGGD